MWTSFSIYDTLDTIHKNCIFFKQYLKFNNNHWNVWKKNILILMSDTVFSSSLEHSLFYLKNSFYFMAHEFLFINIYICFMLRIYELQWNSKHIVINFDQLNLIYKEHIKTVFVDYVKVNCMFLIFVTKHLNYSDSMFLIDWK